MQRILLTLAFVFVWGGVQFSLAGNGNPNPDLPHDTLMFHVQKADNGPKGCATGGGHALFLRHYGGVIVPTFIYITMIDYVWFDDDGDGAADEDPINGLDDDGDLDFDEDPIEIGGITYAIDCDGFPDNDGTGRIRLQIRDSDERKGYVSTQEWWLRLVGKPGLTAAEPNFAFTTHANQTVSCEIVLDEFGVPVLDKFGDPVVECNYGDSGWVELSSFNAVLAPEGCVKEVKLKGGHVQAGGKTTFCDMTDRFYVAGDTDGDETTDDPFNEFIFGVCALDNPDTLDFNEAVYCALTGMVWDMDETNTTSEAKAQVFVGHGPSVSLKSGKITGPGQRP